MTSTIDNIIKILEYINEHPDKDKMLDDLSMTDTNEFQKVLSEVKSGEFVDTSSGEWLHVDDICNQGYISDTDHNDELDEIKIKLTELIDEKMR